jgi:hypothetical protein
MRRITILGLLALLPALAAIGTTTASAESCFHVLGLERGSYTNSSCSTGGPPFTWTWALDSSGFTRLSISPYIYCVKVRAGLRSRFKDAVCADEELNTGLYTKVFAEAGWIWGINPIKGHAKGMQVIHTTAGAVECEELTLSGEAAATEEKSQVLTAKYGKCKGFGSTVTISEAEEEFNADGPVSIVNKNVTITDAGAGCSVTIPSGGSNKALEEAEYTDSSEKVVEKAKISGISYEPSGGACGTKKLETNGKYEGEAEIEESGASVEVELNPFAAKECGTGKHWVVCSDGGGDLAGERLEGTVGLALLASTIGGVEAKFDCLKGTINEESELAGALNGLILFRECTELKPANCKLSAADEKEIDAEFNAQLASGSLELLTGAGASEEFAKIEIASGGGCAVPGTYALTGRQKVETPKGEELLTEHEDVAKKSGSTLKLGTEVASFSDSGKIKLSSGLSWLTRLGA